MFQNRPSLLSLQFAREDNHPNHAQKFTSTLSVPPPFSASASGYCRLYNPEKNTLTRRYLILSDCILYVTRDEQSCSHGHFIDLEFSRMTVFRHSSGHFGFDRRSQYSKHYDMMVEVGVSGTDVCLVFERETDFERWVGALSRLSVREDLHERYRLVERLAGGDGRDRVVGVEAETGRRVVMRVFDKQKMEREEEVREAYRREVRVMKRMDHVNIGRMCEMQEDEHSVYLLFDVADSEPVERWVDEWSKLQNQNEERSDCIVRLLHGLLRAVEYANSLGVVHGNIEMGNVLLRKIDKKGEKTGRGETTEPRSKEQSGGGLFEVVLVGFEKAVCSDRFERKVKHLKEQDHAVSKTNISYIKPDFGSESRRSRKRSSCLMSEFLGGSGKKEEEASTVDVLGAGNMIKEVMDILKDGATNKVFQVSYNDRLTEKGCIKVYRQETDPEFKFHSGLELLVVSLLRESPKERPTATEALRNPVFGSYIGMMNSINEQDIDEFEPSEREMRTSDRQTVVRSMEKKPSRFIEPLLTRQVVSSNASIQLPVVSSKELKFITTLKSTTTHSNSMNFMPSSQASIANLISTPVITKKMNGNKYGTNLSPSIEM